MDSTLIFDGTLAELDYHRALLFEAKFYLDMLRKPEVVEALAHPCEVGKITIPMPAENPRYFVCITWGRGGHVSISMEAPDHDQQETP